MTSIRLRVELFEADSKEDAAGFAFERIPAGDGADIHRGAGQPLGRASPIRERDGGPHAQRAAARRGFHRRLRG